MSSKGKEKESKPRSRMRRGLLPALLLMLFATAYVLGAEDAFARAEITLTPGQTYDVSTAGINTNVLIKRSGSYTLKGKSDHVHVDITCGDVNCYLDDLELKCGVYTNIGQRASAITVENNGGTVCLISKAGKKAYCEGYMAPGIRKDGTATQLIFKTEDKRNPGTIEAAGGIDACGIGGIMYVSSAPWYSQPTGNIVIESGNVIGRGHPRHGAGIGGSHCGSVNGLTISGGDVKAYGGIGGAGIGAGYFGRAANISITGGTVYAETKLSLDTPAAIGGGGGGSGANASFDLKNLTISGGNVTAYSRTGAAIGGGGDSDGKNIRITGGTVKAEVLTQSGKYDPAIGAGGSWSGNTSVFISGGYVEATGGLETVAIGANGGKNGSSVNVEVNISGGTVIAKKGKRTTGALTHNEMDIGKNSNNTEKDNVNVRITGGSVYADRITDPKNDKGEALHRVDVTCLGTLDDVTNYLRNPVCSDGYSYGLNDVSLINVRKAEKKGMFYPWLPNTNGKIMKCEIYGPNPTADLPHYRYGNFPFRASAGELRAATTVALIPANSTEGTAGYAVGIPGEKKLIIEKMPVVPEGEVNIGYSARGDDVRISDADGTLLPVRTRFTTEEGKWNSISPYEELKVMTEPIRFMVHFDANMPKNASTRKLLRGQEGMADDQEIQYGNTTEAGNLRKNTFDLPGYKFEGWATSPTGDVTYADEQNVSKLTSKQGEVVTLYARWSPRKYTVTFNSGAASGYDNEIQEGLEFDQPSRLKSISQIGPEGNKWSFADHSFYAWRMQEDGPPAKVYYYDDGEEFINLCEHDTDGGPVMEEDEHGNPTGNLVGKTITATWIGNGTVQVTTTVDGVPTHITGTGGTKIVISPKGSPSAERNLELLESSEGHYSIPLGSYPDVFPDDASEEWVLMIDGDSPYTVPPGKQDLGVLTATSTRSVILDYYTVGIDPDQHTWASLRESPTSFPSATLEVPDDTTVRVSAYAKPGYHFSGYSCLGVAPVWGDSRGAAAGSQTITVQGRVTLAAKSEANDYFVEFDKNGGSSVTGTMDDQHFVYDQDQQLAANQFKRPGGTFAGWTTGDGEDGETFTDGELINTENQDKLFAPVQAANQEDNEKHVTLHALWDMEEYGIEYDLDGGELPEGESNTGTYTSADTITLNNPVKKEWEFVGWIGTDCDTPATEVVIPEGSTGGRMYTACWKPKSFNVDFEANGGSRVDQQVVVIHGKATRPDDPIREGYRLAGWYADKALTKPFDFNQEILNDTIVYARWTPEQVPVIMAWGTPAGRKAIKTRWTKVPGAAEYQVYGANCGKKLKLIKKTTKTGYTVKKARGKKPWKQKLKAHSPYVLCVVALDKKGNVIATSKKFHVITAKTMGRYANAVKVTAKKKEITLKAGEKAAVEAKVKLPKGKKHLSKKHGAALRYTSNNPLVASVSKKGVVKAKEPGTATIYIQDTGGKYCRVNVTVR